MKGMQIATVLLLAAAVFVNGFPREREVESIEEDAEDVPLPDVPAVSVPAGPAFGYIPSFYSFFPDFELLTRIRGLVTRLRSQIGGVEDIDWNKGNATSTTKVVDGHVVTINETSYKVDDSDLVIHVKVIDVKPTEGDDESVDTSSEATAPETVNNEAAPSASSEETEGNEIPKQPENGVAESLDYVIHPEESREHLIDNRESFSPDYVGDVDTPVDEVDNGIDIFEPIGIKPISLDNDLRVNYIQKEKGGDMTLIPEDVELFEPDNRDLYTVNDKNEYVYNIRHSYEYVPNSRFPLTETISGYT